MGELKVGDRVFGEDGQPCYVVAKSEVWKDRPVYRVTTDDGDTIVADAAHEWRARLCGKRPRFRLYSTAVLARSRQKRAKIEQQKPLQLPYADLPIEPYLLGVWLGDGCSNHATITQSDEDIRWMRRQFEWAGYRTADRATANTFGVIGLQAKLRAEGLLGNKHIPAAYFRASESQRLALLQGLIDTDGHVDPRGQVEFCNTNLALALGVQELVQSLGRKCGIAYGRATLDGRDCGPKYRVTFYMAGAARLLRKFIRCRDAAKKPDRYVSAEPCGTADTVCIEVDSPGHMFLCGRSMLPTHNSEFWSKYFPVWYMGRYPDRRVILGSYNAEYASSWGGEARDLMELVGPEFFGVRVRPDQRSKSDWSLETLDGRALPGRMRTMGMDSGITGKPAELVLIDDPFKSWEEASSPAHREKVWKIYATCISSRQQPETAICLTFTPWNEDDLGGRLLAAQPGLWNVLRMPALAEEEIPAEVRARRKGYAALVGAPDPLGRPPGRAIWPERFDEAHYARKKVLDREVFDALYQCNPHATEGGMFRREWFAGRIRDDMPAGGQYVRYWDKAASDGKGDYTCGALLMAKDGKVWVVDIARDRLDPDRRDSWIRQVCEADNRLYPNVVTWGEHAGNDAKESAGNFIKNLMGFVAFTEGTGNKNKATRAYPFAAYCGQGHVSLRGAHWNDALIDELCDFKQGCKHDDQVDAVSGAFNKLALGSLGVSDYAFSTADDAELLAGDLY